MATNKKRISRFILLFVGFSLIFQFFYLNPLINTIKEDNQGKIFTSTEIPGTKQWLENPTFDTQKSWAQSWGKEEYKSDVNATIGGGHANFIGLGESKEYEINNQTYPLDNNWMVAQNKNISYPDTYYINSDGCYVSHLWVEDVNQSVKAEWERNITMPNNMSDYIITSAELKAFVNATVNNNIDCPGDTGGGDIASGDFVRFYVLISDLEKNEVYEVAYNQTRDLGQDGPPEITTLNDTYLLSVPENQLISLLTSMFKYNHFNFTLTLGMRIWCEDNFNSDTDNWEDLLIKNISLIIKYKKKMNQFTSVSWNQVGERIIDLNDSTVIVTDANFNFKYKIDRNWLQNTESQNSEIKIIINNNVHTETIKLSTANYSFQEAKEDGFDVTSLIPMDKKISLSIQFFLADEFGLGNKINISIDDVYLDISYVIIIPDEPGVDWTLLIIVLIASIAGLVITFSLYQTHFKYPPIVRKIRKLRKRIKKGKTSKQILIKKRQELVKNGSKEQIKILNLEPEKINKNEIKIIEKKKEAL